MAIWTFWLILACGLLIAEVLTQSLTCLYAGLGALIAMVCCLLGYEWIPSIVAFVVSTTVIYLFTYKARRRLLKRLHADVHHAATGMDALIGRTGTLSGGESNLRLRIDGDAWQVRPAHPGPPLKAGDSVRVTAYDSIVLLVEKQIPNNS